MAKKRIVSMLAALVLILGLIPVQVKKANAATKGYSVTKDSGTYSSTVQTSVKVKKGYKVYYTTSGSFSTSKVIKSGKTKTFTIKKNTTIKLIVVKKNKKVTTKKLNKSLKSKAKTYKYKISKTETQDSSSIKLKAASNYATPEEGEGYKIEADGENSVLTISKSGSYSVSTDGTVTGQIVNKATDGEVTLILNGVDLKNANAGDDGVILNKKSVSPLNVVLAAGSDNTLTATGEGQTETKSDGTTDTDYPAGIMIKKGSALTISGTGKLSINSTHGSGIKVKYNDTENDISTLCANDSNFWTETLTIKDDPTINIVCNSDDEAAYKNNNYNTDKYDAHQDGISSKNSLGIYGGTINIAAGDDGIHAEATAKITNGKITVSSSTEALEGAKVQIDGGTVNLKAYDDGINAANSDLTANTSGEDTNIFSITINGGTVTVDAEGDGIDSNGNAYITGGDVKVYGPSKGGNGALDVADQTGVFLVTGGTLYATAAGSDMAVTPSNTSYSSVVFALNNNGMGMGGQPPTGGTPPSGSPDQNGGTPGAGAPPDGGGTPPSGSPDPNGGTPGNNTTTSGTTIEAGTTLTIKDSSGNTVGSLTTKKTTGWILYCGSNITKDQTYTLYSGSTQVA